MESLGDILKRLRQQNIFADTDSPDSLAVVPEEGQEDACPLCRGTSWVQPDVPVGHPDFGEAFPCTCQKEATEEQRLARFQRFSNLGPLIGWTFEAVVSRCSSTDLEDRLFQTALERTRSYAEEPIGWLVLTGRSGGGKTHLAAAVANRCIQRGVKVFFISVPDLLDHLRASFAPESEIPYDELFEQVKNVPLLVLDDMGAHSTTPWAQEKLYQVLNHRFAFSLPTVVALSLALDQVEERLRTRLQDSRLAWVVPVASDFTETAELGSLAPEMLKRMTFDSFKISGNRASSRQKESLRHAREAARSFAKGPDGWLLLIGDSGCGKTHLAVAVAEERLKVRDTPMFWPVPDLLDHLRYTFSPESRVTYDKVFEEVKRCPLLILDDLGAEVSTPWATEKLYQIIVHRQNVRLPTIITARELYVTKHRDPIASRLNDSRLVNVVPIDAPDYRNQERIAPPR